MDKKKANWYENDNKSYGNDNYAHIALPKWKIGKKAGRPKQKG